jgi:hypothetical protein
MEGFERELPAPVRHFYEAILAIMKKASITEAKNNLSALIDSVKGGSPVLIVDRGADRVSVRTDSWPCTVWCSLPHERFGDADHTDRTPASHLFNAASQFRTTEIGGAVAPATAMFIRRRPSTATAYCCFD